MKLKKKKTKEIPKTMMQSIGSLKVTKGSIGDLPIVIWDALDMCKGEECILFGNGCPYMPKQGLPCTIQMKYIRQVYAGYMNNLLANDEVDSIIVTKIGFHLIPLYVHLIKMKIEEHGSSSIWDVDGRGNRKVNPVYKEIRETIKTITAINKDLFGYKNAGVEMPDVSSLVKKKGDPNFFQNQMEEKIIEVPLESKYSTRVLTEEDDRKVTAEEIRRADGVRLMDLEDEEDF